MAIIDANNDGIALDGFDPVSYFNNEPLRGDSTLSFELDGVNYYFANEENLLKFQENPAKFIPAYGGYCAFGVANGEQRMGNAGNYSIRDGRLFFFYRNDLEDARVSWENDVPAYTKQADDNWLKNSQNPSMEMQNLSDSEN